MTLEEKEMIKVGQASWALHPPGLPPPLHVPSFPIVSAHPTFPVSFTANSRYPGSLKVSVPTKALSHMCHITLAKPQFSHLKSRD